MCIKGYAKEDLNYSEQLLDLITTNILESLFLRVDNTGCLIVKGSHGTVPSWEILLSPNRETEFETLGVSRSRKDYSVGDTCIWML